MQTRDLDDLYQRAMDRNIETLLKRPSARNLLSDSAKERVKNTNAV